MVDLRLGDCLDVLPTLASGSVDAVVTDPPYCSGAHEAAKRTKRSSFTPESVTERPTIDSDAMGTLGFEWVSRRWLLAARRATREGGHLICFTDWRMLPQTATLIEAAGWRWNNTIVWDKGYPGLGAGFRAQYELIISASNGSPEWYSYEFGNVLKSMRLTKTDHPHQKPIELLQQILQTCSPDGGTVLDPFMGSGSTGVAAVKLGYSFIGLEIAEQYFAIAQRRIEQAQAQLALPLWADAVP